MQIGRSEEAGCECLRPDDSTTLFNVCRIIEYDTAKIVLQYPHHEAIEVRSSREPVEKVEGSAVSKRAAAKGRAVRTNRPRCVLSAKRLQYLRQSERIRTTLRSRDRDRAIYGRLG